MEKASIKSENLKKQIGQENKVKKRKKSLTIARFYRPHGLLLAEAVDKLPYGSNLPIIHPLPPGRRSINFCDGMVPTSNKQILITVQSELHQRRKLDKERVRSHLNTTSDVPSYECWWVTEQLLQGCECSVKRP